METTLVIVEGSSDTKSFQHFFRPEVRSVPSRGKEMVLLAYEELEPENLSNCLWIVDCDGETAAKWLGKPNLVVSANRDVDADLLIELSALERIGREYFGSVIETSKEIDESVNRYFERALLITSILGALLDAARHLDFPVRISDIRLARRRPVRPLDLEGITDWAVGQSVVDVDLVTKALGNTLGWTNHQTTEVMKKYSENGKKLCRLHQCPSCNVCMSRRFSGGHHLTDVISLQFGQRAGFEIGPAELSRAIRMSARRESVEDWPVVKRIRRWETKGGTMVVA